MYRSESLQQFISRLEDMMSDEEFTLRVRRSNVLEDSLEGLARNTFSSFKKLNVSILQAL